MDSIILSRRSPTSNHTRPSSRECIKLPKRNGKYKTTSSMPSSHPSPTASRTPKFQRIPHLLPQPNHLQAMATSQVARRFQQAQVVLLLLSTTRRKLHHH